MRSRSIQSTLLGHTSVLKKGQHKHISTLEQIFSISAKRKVERE